MSDERNYTVECDVCHTQEGFAQTGGAALLQALRAGWSRQAVENCETVTYRDLCKACAAEALAASRFKW